MTRGQWILAAALAVQLLLLGLLSMGGDDRGASEPRALIPDLEAFTPVRLEIDGAEGDPVALRREGEGWVLDDPDGFPADGEKVEALLDKLEPLQVRRPVVTSSRYHGALEVADDAFKRRLRIWDRADGDPHVELYLGTSPSYETTHARSGGDDRVYEIRGLGTFDLRTERASWIDRRLLDVDQDRLAGITLRNEHGRLELARESGAWRLVSPAPRAGGEFDPEEAASWVRSVTSIFISEPGPKADSGGLGLDDPVATLEIRTRGEVPEGAPEDAEAPLETTTIRIGGPANGDGDDGRRYASRSGFGFAVVLSGFDVERFTGTRASDFHASEE